VALILARRRGERVELIRTLIIVAGATSLAAALLGWMTAGFTLADPDWIHAWHRALGTGLALAGAVVAWWAWRRRDALESRAMIAGLLLITIALAVQGWLGAALVHGIEHMAF
jgi:heme A synthase